MIWVIKLAFLAGLLVYVHGSICPTNLPCSDCIESGCAFHYSPHGVHFCGAGYRRQFAFKIRQVESCKSLTFDAPPLLGNNPSSAFQVQTGDEVSTAAPFLYNNLHTSTSPTGQRTSSSGTRSVTTGRLGKLDADRADFLMKLRRSNCLQYVVLYHQIHRRRSADVELEKCNKKIGRELS